jgi:hypothetical protein
LIGNLGLSPQDESDIVAFLKTLSDRFVTIPAAPLLRSVPEPMAPAKERKPN